MSKYKFTCDFCGKQFTHEGWFLKHHCKEMKRHEESQTPIGQAAWRFYQLWLTKYRRRPRGHHTFLSSQFYNAFIKFAKFVKDTSLPETDFFIDFVILKKYDPNLWTDGRVYSAYLEHLDRVCDPLTRFASTIKRIQKYAANNDLEIKDFFDHVTPPEIIHMVYSRELSPWFILNSSKFWLFYKNKVNSSEKVRMEGLIRFEFWKDRFAKHPDLHNDMKNMVKRLNL